MGRKPALSQQQLDFETRRRDQFRWVSMLTESEVLRQLLGPQRSLKVALLLERINARRGCSDSYQAPMSQLAAITGQSPRNTRRTVRDAESLGLLDVQEFKTCGGTGFNVYRVEWEKVRSMAEQRHPPIAPGQDGRALGQDGRALGQDGRALGQDGRANKDIYPDLESGLDPPPPTPSPPATANPDPWMEEEEYLRGKPFELRMADEVISLAKRNGYRPDQVREIADHWLELCTGDGPPAWASEGAILARIKFGRPDRPAADCWPDKSPSHVAWRRRQLQQRVDTQAAEQRRIAQQRHQAEQAARYAKAARYGPVLDRMSPAELDAFAAEALQDNQLLLKRWRRGGLQTLVREQLIDALASRSLVLVTTETKRGP